MFRPINVTPLFATMSEVDSGATINPLRDWCRRKGITLGPVVLAAAFTRTMMIRE